MRSRRSSSTLSPTCSTRSCRRSTPPARTSPSVGAFGPRAPLPRARAARAQVGGGAAPGDRVRGRVGAAGDERPEAQREVPDGRVPPLDPRAVHEGRVVRVPPPVRHVAHAGVPLGRELQGQGLPVRAPVSFRRGVASRGRGRYRHEAEADKPQCVFYQQGFCPLLFRRPSVRHGPIASTPRGSRRPPRHAVPLPALQAGPGEAAPDRRLLPRRRAGPEYRGRDGRSATAGRGRDAAALLARALP